MKKLFLMLPLAFAALVSCAAPKSDSPDENTNKPASKNEPIVIPNATNRPVFTTNTITIGGERVKYVAETGMLPVLKKDGSTIASVFYVAYTRAP
jgi:carboxypeptidase C (cathepsin A)